MIIYLNVWLISIQLAFFERVLQDRQLEGQDRTALPVSCGLFLLRRGHEAGDFSTRRLL